MTAIHLDLCLASLSYISQRVGSLAGNGGFCHRAATDSGYLTAAEDTVAHMTALERYHSLINTTVVDIAAAEDTACIGEEGVGRGLCVILNLLYILLVDLIGVRVVSAFGIIHITYIAVVQGYVGCAEDGTTLTTAVGITLHGGNTAEIGAACKVANDYMSLGRSRFSADITQPTAAIYVTA